MIVVQADTNSYSVGATHISDNQGNQWERYLRYTSILFICLIREDCPLATRQTHRLAPGTLWQRTRAQTAHALQCGALQPIPTDFVFVEHGGVRFLVRVVEHLTRKDAALQQQHQDEVVTGTLVNPFLPYDEDLFVADISATHLCLLNKFNVIDHHLLIVTRAFEEQESLLTVEDFTALWTCMAEVDGLAFYNAGKVAGASQRHKHLQLVPFPLVPEGLKVPIAPAIAAARFNGPCGIVPVFPYLHALTRVEPGWQASDLFACYQMLLRAVGLLRDKRGEHEICPPYNLLVTREWMLLVPRAYEQCESLSVNALGFAGAFLVRNVKQLSWLTAYGPMRVLQQVAVAADTTRSRY